LVPKFVSICYGPFCPKFCCHGNRGQSGVNINDTIKLADPENNTLELKIITQSYTEQSYDGLNHCLIFPIDTIVIFHIFLKNRLKCETFHLVTTSLCKTASYEASCIKIGSVVFFPVEDGKKKKKGKERKEKAQKVIQALYFTYLWGPPTNGFLPNFAHQEICQT